MARAPHPKGTSGLTSLDGPSLARRARAWRYAVIGLLLLHYLMLLGITLGNAPVVDEIGHLTAGIHQWKHGTFYLYRVNPPLVKWIAAIPALLGDPVYDWSSAVDALRARPEFEVGFKFIEINGLDAFWYHTAGRVMVLPLTVLGGWVCFLWARDLYGSRAGFLACLLWCFSPLVLGWGSTFTPDAAAASLGCLAGYRFWKWLRSGEWGDALIAGLALGFVELTKTTWTILFVLWPLLWVCWRVSLPKSLGTSLPRLRQLVVILLCGLFLINAGYGFEGSFTRLGNYEFTSEALTGREHPHAAGNRFRGTWLENVPVPLPWNYLRGIDQQKSDFDAGMRSFLLGEWSDHGWWYFYIVALVFKEPLGTWGIFLLAIGTVIWNRTTWRQTARDELVLLLPSLAVMVLVSSHTGFTIYLRYVLPCLPFVFVFCSRVVRIDSALWSKVAAGCLAAWAIVSTSLAYPHEISYFNELAGGPRGGRRVLHDANVDYGQDLLRLRRWVIDHPEARPFYLSTHFLPAEYLRLPADCISTNVSDGFEPSPGWYAFGPAHDGEGERDHETSSKFVPVDMIGYSLVIYHVSAADETADGD